MKWKNNNAKGLLTKNIYDISLIWVSSILVVFVILLSNFIKKIKFLLACVCLITL